MKRNQVIMLAAAAAFAGLLVGGSLFMSAGGGTSTRSETNAAQQGGGATEGREGSRTAQTAAREAEEEGAREQGEATEVVVGEADAAGGKAPTAALRKELPPVDTGNPTVTDVCEGLKKDRKALRLTEDFLEKIPEKNLNTQGAQNLRDLRDRTKRSIDRRTAAAKASGTVCPDGE